MTADFGNFVAKNDEKRKMKWTRQKYRKTNPANCVAQTQNPRTQTSVLKYYPWKKRDICFLQRQKKAI